MHDHNKDEQKWHLAMKVLSNSLEPEEQAEWEALKNDTQFLQEFRLVEKYWNKIDTLPYQQIDTEKDWKTVWDRVRHQAYSKRRRMHTPWLKYAATIAVGMAVSFFAGWSINQDLFTNGGRDTRTTIEAPSASKTFITLPDSSTVWLNAKSKLSFDKDFAKANRDLRLEGEAFFDVRKSDVPFTVQTPVYQVTVLGTAFNINAYKDDVQSVTTLVRGALKITYTDKAGKKSEHLLHPNEKLVAANTGSGYVFSLKKEIDAELETAWKDGWLSVQGESLHDLAKRIERLYDVKIEFQDEGLQRYRYTGRLRQLSLEQVLKALSLTSPVEFTIDEKTVILRENKSAKSKYRSLQAP